MKKFIVAAVAASLMFASTASAAFSTQELNDLALILGVDTSTDAWALVLANASDASGTTTTTTSSSQYSAAVGCQMFVPSMTIGARGSEVSRLQQFLMEEGHYNYAGGVTGYFGNVTKNAVSAYQVTNSVSPTVGFFGPLTAGSVNGKIAAACSSTSPVVPPTTVPPTTVPPVVVDHSHSDVDSRLDDEEADIVDFNVSDASDDTIENGDVAVVVGEIEFDVEDAAVLMERAELVFDYAGGDDESDADDTFEMVHLIVDGVVVGSVDADSSSDWDDDSLGANGQEIVIKGMDHLFDIDDNHVIEVAVDVQNGVDDGNLSEDWEIYVKEIRFDDGVDYLESNSGTGTMDFSIEEEGADDELTFSTASNDPNAMTIEVDDTSDSNEEVVFIFDVEADKDGSDIMVKEFEFDVLIDNTAGTVAVDSSDLIDEVNVSLSGEMEKADENSTVVVAAGATGTVTYNVEFSNYAEIAADDTEEVEISMVFGGTGSGNSTPDYDSGVTIQVSITPTAANFDAEGSDDLTNSQLTGSATVTSDVHTLQEDGISVDLDTNITTSASADNDTVTVEVDFTVNAFGDDDVYIPTTTAVMYTVEETDGTTPVTTVTTTDDISSNANQVSNSYEIAAGSSEDFTLTVQVSGTDGQPAQLTQIQLDSVVYDFVAGGTANSFALVPDYDYETGSFSIER